MSRFAALINLAALVLIGCEQTQQPTAAEKPAGTPSTTNSALTNTEDTLYRNRDYRIVGRSGASILVSLKANPITGSERRLDTLFQNSDITVLGDNTAEPLYVFQRFVARHRFADFPASAFRGKSAKPDFASNREAKLYKTNLTEGPIDSANFAGHYHLVTWGSGTNSQQSAIADLKTGKIHWVPAKAEWLSYQADSQLLITDYEPDIHKGWYLLNSIIIPQPAYYIWTSKEFKKLD